MKAAVEERFWAKVDRSGGPDSCWPWTASTFRERNGYGKFQAGTSRATSRIVYAHRFAWELVHGSISDGLFVCHRCDNPPCCHVERCLFLGTAADNTADMMAKGRRVYPPKIPHVLRGPREQRGELNASAKLSWAVVAEMRASRESGWTYQRLADSFGISLGAAWCAVNGRTWGSRPDASSTLDRRQM